MPIQQSNSRRFFSLNLCPVQSQVLGPNYQCQVWVSTCDMGFKLNQKLTGYSQDIFVTIIPRDICCQGHCKLQLSGSIQHLKTLGKSARKDEASLCSTTQVSDVFNRVCLSVPGGQPTALAINSSNVWESMGPHLPLALKGTPLPGSGLFIYSSAISSRGIVTPF